MALLGWAICSVVICWVVAVVLIIGAPLVSIVILITDRGRAETREAFRLWPWER